MLWDPVGLDAVYLSAVGASYLALVLWGPVLCVPVL